MAKTIETLIDEAWDKLFDKITNMRDDLYELKVEYMSTCDGKTITRSWKDREQRLGEEDEE